MKHPIAVLGLPLDSLTSAEAVNAIEDLIHSGGTHQVATANLDFWLNSIKNPHLHRILASCSLVLPDGMPLVWVSRLFGKALPERVTGVDLVPQLADLSARKGYRIFLLGGKPGVANRTADVLERDHPGVNIVGTYSPFHEELAQMDHAEIIHRIRAAKPDILLVAFGNPKQEKWIWMHRKRLGVPVSMGVGGTFDILVGDMKRAPRWIQQCGLEWLMRLAQEPVRLAPRYFRDFVGLMQRLPLALLAAWTQLPDVGASSVNSFTDPREMHVYLHGNLTAETIPLVQRALDAAIARGLTVVAHIQTVHKIDAEGLGFLMAARRQLINAGLAFSLATLSVKLRFLFHCLCAKALFEERKSPRTHGLRVVERDATAFGNLSGTKGPIPIQMRSRG
jgi:N-acetylglucosaminyldiphosphoundecaprenol N-acetyl-beta-D-mannosaminyltransferase